MRVRLGIHPSCWIPKTNSSCDRESLLRCLSETTIIGFSGVEWVSMFPNSPHVLQNLLAEIQLNLTGVPLEICMKDNLSEFNFESLRNSYSLCQATHCSNILLQEMTEQQLWLDKKSISRSCSDRDKLFQLYESLSLKIRNKGFTPLFKQKLGGVLSSAADLEELIERSPSLDLVFEPSLLNLLGIDYNVFLEKHYSRIKYIHLDNLEQLEKGHQRTYLTEGKLNFDDMWHQLVKNKFEGWCIIKGSNILEGFHPFTFARKSFLTIQTQILKNQLTLNRTKEKAIL
jgi:sugar phosphate isomerase/epimerase